jgi:DNA-binding response OmpR family regulator
MASALPALVEPDLALLAERDPALRQLIALALKNAGYDVRQCSNTLQLKAELYSSPILTTQRALLVLNLELAVQCAVELSTLERVRSKARASRPSYLLICEFGGSKQFALPSVEQLEVIGILEKPFDLDELERLARTFNETGRVASGRRG